MALTRKQALLNCKKMWQYIATTGFHKDIAIKVLWPNKTIANNCWACEFSLTYDISTDTKIINCKKCILWKYSKKEYMCCTPSSSFYNYFYAATLTSKRIWAKKILTLCDKRIKEYEQSTK